MKKIIVALAAVLLGAVAIGSDAADTYPKRPITLIVPFAAGGSGDAIARIVADAMSRNLGQPLVVDNRTGAGSIVGTSVVARSPSDGYTILFTSSAHAINVTFRKDLPYDSIKGFEPIATLGFLNFLLVVPEGSPINDFGSLVSALRDSKSKLNFGSAGVGTPMHLGPELIKLTVHGHATHVPYRGEAGVVTALLSNQIDFALCTVAICASLVKQGKMKALMTTAPHRLPSLPDVPTAVEVGYPSFQVYSWYVLLAPERTPKDVISKLNASANTALKDATLLQRLGALGLDVRGPSTPSMTSNLIATEATKWAPIIKQSGAVPE